LSPKRPVQALQNFLVRPDAFPDKSGPTGLYKPVGGDLSPKRLVQALQNFLVRPDASRTSPALPSYTNR
jgi:hypothetical protein